MDPPPSMISSLGYPSSLLWYLERSWYVEKSFPQGPELYRYNVDTFMFVLSYIFQFISNLDDYHHSHFTDAAPVILALEDIATFLHHQINIIGKFQLMPKPTPEIQSKQVELSEMLVSSFFPDVVPRFFTVPKLHHLNQTDQHKLHANEIIAAFIDFLLQVLFHQTNISEAEVQHWALVRKELSFLLALLGDIPFQCTHLHQEFVQETNTLLAEFEALANVAGTMVYDGIFSNHPMEADEFHEKTLAWFEKIQLLSANIKEHCFKFSELPMSVISRSRVVDSFFIIHSLIEDIQNLNNHGLNFIGDDDIMEQMRKLHDVLTLSQSFIKGVQCNEEKEVLVQIRDLTYEAEYLINSLVLGNMQVWYPRIRLPSIIRKIELANGTVSLPTTENMETTDNNHFLDFSLDVMQRILMGESEDMNDLEVRYKHLPPEIKPCFLYFAAFPKDSEISQKKLTSLWIEEGFIQKQGNKSIEETAEMYLLYLIDRKFVLVVKGRRNGAIHKCKMQSLLHEFCVRKAYEENFIKFTNGFSMYEKCQRLCVADTESCNSWRPFGLHCRSYRDLRTGHKSSCFQTMPLLKVLHRSPLPEEINSWPAASTFPSQLRMLSYVCVNGKKDEDILRCSPHLRKLKCRVTGPTRRYPDLIKLKCRVTDPTRRYPDVSFLGELESLKISFGHYVTANIISSQVKFPLTIKKLCLSGGKLRWEMMSIIGVLPNLQDLKLKRDAFSGEVWETREGEFQKLRCLKLFECLSLRVWISCSEHFPVLECLVVKGCRKLCDIPLDFGNILTLHTIRVTHSSDNAYLSALHIGKHIQEVYVESSYYMEQEELVQQQLRNREFVQKLRNGSRSELMNVLSLMGEYHRDGGSQQDQTEDQTTTTTTTDDGDEQLIFSCDSQTYFVVISFAMQFSSDLQKQALTDTIIALRCIAASYNGRTEILPGHPRYVDEIKKSRREFSNMLVNSFIPQVQGFFQLPKIEQLFDHKGNKHLNRNEILAGFMDFLLQVLFPVAERCALLHSEFSFLLALMGDIPFQPTEHPEFGNQLNNLLAEFEMLANKTGGFLFSCVFPIQPISCTSFHAETDALLGEAKILHAKIEEHCINFSKLPVSATLRSKVVDSFFIIQSLVEDLQSIITNGQLGNFTPDDTIKEQMKELHGELTLSLSFFKFIRENDTNEKKVGLIQIRDLAYEAEYLINSLRLGSIHVWYLNLRLPSIISKMKIACKGLHRRILETENASEVKVSFPITGNTATIDTNQILDFDDEISHKILENLTGALKSPRHFILIFGMPGLGKTTTASKLYNGGAVCTRFDRRAWCVVSENYDVRGLLNQILVGLGDENLKPEENDAAVGLKIYQTLYGRRYLIILDDIWHPEVFDSLIRYFPDNGNGSRVLITTRNKNVCPSGSILYELPFLSEDQCWNLLEKKVFPNDPCPPHLVIIGKRIAARCSGVPLAVVSIAGVLVNVEKEESEWQRVEEGVNSMLLDDQREYRKIMDVSYHHLPHNIKPCFLSFAGYPEDAEIPKKELIRFWIAQGFIQKDGCKRPEDIAEMYLLDLINRSLVMIGRRTSGGEIKTCRIHDLLRDLCIKQADEDNFLNSTKLFCIYDKHQHLCHPSSSIYSNGRIPAGLHCRSLRCHAEKSSGIYTMGLLKAVVLFGAEYNDYSYNHPIVDHPVVNLPCQLKYLGIIGVAIISKIILDNLVDLEFIHVVRDSYSEVVHVPSAVLRMAKLRHLSVRKKLKFEEDSSSNIPERTNLRSLSVVVIKTNKDEEILRNSPHLQTLKCHIEQGGEAPDLSSHAELESLRMEFFYRILGIEHVVELKFLPSSIKKLCLARCGLPWEKMSIIGQLPKLEVLKLEYEAFVGEEWETKDDEFKELKYLKILYTADLKYWISESYHFPSLECLVLECCEYLVRIPSDFPSLECLVLFQCSSLKEIPSDLGTIPTLMEIRLQHCSKEACISGILIEKEQRESYGNEELQVNITSHSWTKEELIQDVTENNSDEQSSSSFEGGD